MAGDVMDGSNYTSHHGREFVTLTGDDIPGIFRKASKVVADWHTSGWQLVLIVPTVNRYPTCASIVTLALTFENTVPRRLPSSRRIEIYREQPLVRRDGDED